MPLNKPIVLFLFVLLTVQAVSPKGGPEAHREIIDAFEARNNGKALNLLRVLRADDPHSYEANNYDYLEARISEMEGDAATAAANYQGVIARGSALRDHGLLHLSHLMRTSGNLFAERLFLRELAASSDNEHLRSLAVSRLVRSYLESKDYGEVIRLFEGKSGVDGRTEGPEANGGQDTPLLRREDKVLLARAHMMTGQLDRAKLLFGEIVEDIPVRERPDDLSFAAVSALDQMDGTDGDQVGKTAKLPDGVHFERASVYQFNRAFRNARLHFDAILEHHPQSKFVAECLFQIARGYEQERDYHNAIGWYERVQAEFPDDEISKTALYRTASAYSSLNKVKEAVSRFERFIQENPGTDEMARAYLNIVDLYRDIGEPTEAVKRANLVEQTFGDKLPGALAVFARARIHISEKNWRAALIDLSRLSSMPDLGGGRIAGGTTLQEVNFLRGFVLEEQKRFAEAVDAYLSVEDGGASYHGGRATERVRKLSYDEGSSGAVKARLSALEAAARVKLSGQNADVVRKAAQSAFRLSDDPNKRIEFIEILKRTYELIPGYRIQEKQAEKSPGRRKVRNARTAVPMSPGHGFLADELIFLGLADEAAIELALERRDSTGLKGKTLVDPTVSEYYAHGDLAHLAVSSAEERWKDAPSNFVLELIPEEDLRLLYPAPFRRHLLKYSAVSKVDPRFVLSIMRQESRFKPEAKSGSAARGLMQFIPETSRKTAGELRLEGFRQDDLYDPEVSIRFGAAHISHLFGEFPDQPAAVAAAYNAGEDRMLRWFVRAHSNDPDVYVPEVIFAQTKDYVQKIMANYRIYLSLYDENLEPHSKISGRRFAW